MEPAGKHRERVEVDRRALLKRGAAFGAAVAWATPTVQTLASPAFATGSARCDVRLEQEGCEAVVYDDSAECCDCITAQLAAGVSHDDAIRHCAAIGACVPLGPEICGEEEEKPPPEQPPAPPGGTQEGSDDVPVPTVVPAGT